MKILQLMAGAEHGGAETAFIDMCIALHEAGHEIEVGTRANKIRVPRLEKAGIKTHTLPFGGKLDVLTRWKLKKIIKDFKPTIVQTWMSRASMHAPAWTPKCGAPRYHVVSRLGGYYSLKYFKNTDYFATITPDIRNYLIRESVHPDHVRHINNFAETEEAPTPVDRATLHTPEGANVILALGRLHTSKAFDTLIKAVSKTSKTHLWIAGEGPDRIELEALITELDLNERVKLLGWRSDRAALFQAADICAFPSRYEPFGTVFVQAWAQNTPLISTMADGPRQFVRDGIDGLLVPIDDIDALAEAITRITEDKELQKTLITNGQEHYQRAFTKEQCVRAYIRYYEEIESQAIKAKSA